MSNNHKVMISVQLNSNNKHTVANKKVPKSNDLFNVLHFC